MNPHRVTEETIGELHNRSQQKLKQLFPGGIPGDIHKRMNREMSALAGSPYIYALLIADEVIKELRKYNFAVELTGDWVVCYYTWLLGLTGDDPFAVAKYFQSIGWRIKQLIRDKCIESPMEIAVSPTWAKPACLELLRIHANDWGFWVWEGPDGNFKLINLSCRPDDIYAACAPVIRIVNN